MPLPVIRPQSEGDQPVFSIDDPEDRRGPQPGMGLCLSGGGFRAMLFHVGSLWRLNEAGLLNQFDRISSVSGGSIASALLGLRWNQLDFDSQGVAARFKDRVVEPLRSLARRTIDEKAIAVGAITPFVTISGQVVKAYDKHLFDGAKLTDIPAKPRFVINATNVQSGALWRFSSPYMADYRVGRILATKRTVSLAEAVAASSAFPPFLSPMVLSFRHSDYEPKETEDLHFEPYTTDVVLTDGGVYDNLGLETVWKRYKTVLVSDGGAGMAAEPDPKRDWAQHSFRVTMLIDNQVRSLRKRQLIDSFRPNDHDGAYWGIGSHITNYGLPDALPCPLDRTTELANTPTRLKRIDETRQERLINWGYAMSDAAIRKHLDPSMAKPKGFPYPEAGV
jgi:NTE family protein